MIVAEAAHARTYYPTVPEQALQHLLWALHRMVPVLARAGEVGALPQLFTDLAAYNGSLEDFGPFDIPRLIDAICAGRAAVADQLAARHLLQPGSARW